MRSLYSFYFAHASFLDTLICLALFLGVAKLAFWRRGTGFHVSGSLVVGMTLLLTVSLIWWAGEHGYRMLDLGPLAAFVVVEAVVVLIINFAVRSR